MANTSYYLIDLQIQFIYTSFHKKKFLIKFLPKQKGEIKWYPGNASP
jgi:hypothetical protein